MTAFHTDGTLPPSSGLADFHQTNGSTPFRSGAHDGVFHDWEAVGPHDSVRDWGTGSAAGFGSPFGWGCTRFGAYAPPFYTPFYAPLVNLCPVFPADLYAPPIVPLWGCGPGPFW